MDALWTIDELNAAVVAALSARGPQQNNGQVREIPDRRTIRYYTMLGLIDRPASMRGRTALYGKRHLEQLVAIKRLQAEGKTLAEIQSKLTGITTRELRALARVSIEAPEPSKVEAPASRRSQTFWTEPVADAAVVEEPMPARIAEEQAATRALSTLVGVRLDDNATLLLDTNNTLSDDEIDAIQRAAEPLLQLLHARGFTRKGKEK